MAVEIKTAEFPCEQTVIGNNNLPNSFGLNKDLHWELPERAIIKKAYWRFTVRARNVKINTTVSRTATTTLYFTSSENAISDEKILELEIGKNGKRPLNWEGKTSGDGFISFTVKQDKGTLSPYFGIHNLTLVIEYDPGVYPSKLSLSASKVTLNPEGSSANKIIATVTPGDPAYKHQVHIALMDGNVEKQSATLNFNPGVTSQTFAPAEGYWLPYMQQRTSAELTVTFKTFENDSAATPLFTPEVSKITINVSDYGSKLSLAILTLTANTVGNAKIFLQKASTLKAVVCRNSSDSITNPTAVTGYYNSNITELTLKINGKNGEVVRDSSTNAIKYATLDYGTFDRAGTYKIVASIKDDRGMSKTIESSITVEEYSPPVINEFIAGRWAAKSGGTVVQGNPDAEGTYGYAITTVTSQARIGPASGGLAVQNYVEYFSAPSLSTESKYLADYSGSYAILKSGQDTYATFDSQYSHTIYVRVTDYVVVGNNNQVTLGTATSKASIPTGAVFMSWRKRYRAFGFGGIPNREDSFYIAKTKKIHYGDAVVVPGNYRTFTFKEGNVTLEPETSKICKLKDPARTDQNPTADFSGDRNKYFSDSDGAIVCTSNCLAEFTGSLYLGTGFNSDFSVYLRRTHEDGTQDDDRIIARINPWNTAMNCTWTLPAATMSVQKNDKINLIIRGGKNIGNSATIIDNGSLTYIRAQVVCLL